MSTEENKAIVKRYYEEMDKGNTNGLLALLSESFQLNMVGVPYAITPQNYGALLDGYQSAFPGYHHELGNQIVEGDAVVTPLTFYGTHNGDFQGLPPTGKDVVVQGLSIHRFANGKIVEHEAHVDNLGMMQQLGIIPTE